MNAEQKQRAAQMLRRFSQANPRTLSADNAAVDMAALLHELIDAPEQAAGVPGGPIPLIVQTAMQGLLTGDDMANLRRFAECCEDCDADGHDVARPKMKRLELVGVVRPCGFGRHETTAFGDWLLAAAPQAPAVQADQSEQHLEMVKRELFQARQSLLNEGQQRDKLLAALEELLSGTMSMPNRGRATEGKWTTINALTDTVEKARSVVAEAKGE